jgi:hypothetical protein
LPTSSTWFARYGNIAHQLNPDAQVTGYTIVPNSLTWCARYYNAGIANQRNLICKVPVMHTKLATGET